MPPGARRRVSHRWDGLYRRRVPFDSSPTQREDASCCRRSLPQAVIDEIGRLDPFAIVILGGEAVISPSVRAQLEAILGF